jgi:hypothetical protein
VGRQEDIMARLTLLIIAALALPLIAAKDPNTRKICVYGDGASAAAVCFGQAPGDDDICHCPPGAKEVVAPNCAPDERAPPENAAFRHARRDAVAHSNTLLGVTFNTRSMCVDPRSRTTR